MSELVFVKLGGSIITDKQQPFVARPQLIRQLAGELKAALEARPHLSVLLGHGSGSFGHIPARKYGVHQGIASDADWWGFAETGVAAARLNRIVTDVFLDVGVPVWSVQPSASARCTGGRLVYLATEPVCEAIERGLVPIVHGDVAFDTRQGCTIVSTEQVFTYLAHEMPTRRMVMVGEVDGVYDRDPLAHPDAIHIPRITPASFARLRPRLGGSHAIDVTGGMLSKVQAMVSIVSDGQAQRVHLISGRRVGALSRVLLDERESTGTVIERDGEGRERN